MSVMEYQLLLILSQLLLQPPPWEVGGIVEICGGNDPIDDVDVVVVEFCCVDCCFGGGAAEVFQCGECCSKNDDANGDTCNNCCCINCPNRIIVSLVVEWTLLWLECGTNANEEDEEDATTYRIIGSSKLK